MTTPSKRKLDWRGISFLVSLLLGLVALLFILVPAEWFKRNVKEEKTSAIRNMVENDPLHQISMLEEMWTKFPDHAPIALQLGNLYFDQGAFPMAAKYYREFLKVDTSAAGFEVTLDLARALFHMNRGDDAVAELKAMLEKHPDHAGALYNLGALQANMGDLGSAKQSWQRLIKVHPDDSLAMFAKQSLPMLELPAGHP